MGRFSGSEDEARAFDYIEEVLKGRSCLRIERYEVPAYISIPIDGKVIVKEKNSMQGRHLCQALPS